MALRHVGRGPRESDFPANACAENTFVFLLVNEQMRGVHDKPTEEILRPKRSSERTDSKGWQNLNA
jgi:hypothetical protein